MTSPSSSGYQTELLVLPDGRILAHNITPAVAAILSELAPHDIAIRARARVAPNARHTQSVTPSRSS